MWDDRKVAISRATQPWVYISILADYVSQSPLQLNKALRLSSGQWFQVEVVL